jgi:hypothetical protein
LAVASPSGHLIPDSGWSNPALLPPGLIQLRIIPRTVAGMIQAKAPHSLSGWVVISACGLPHDDRNIPRS